MDCDRSCGSTGNICIVVLISVVVATIVALLFAFDLIPNVITAVWIVFGFAVLNLIFLVVGLFGASIFRRTLLGRCLCCNGTVLLVAIVATIILALAALAIDLVITSIPIIILIALGGFFATLMTVEFLLLLSCLLKGQCCCRE